MTVTDGELSDNVQFVLYIGSVNDAPVLSDISDKQIDEDTSLDVTLSALDIDADDLYFSVSSDTVDVIASLSGTLLTLTPASNWNGMSNISVTVSDGELTDTKDFELNVIPINDTPVLSDLSLIHI